MSERLKTPKTKTARLVVGLLFAAFSLMLAALFISQSHTMLSMMYLHSSSKETVAEITHVIPHSVRRGPDGYFINYQFKVEGDTYTGNDEIGEGYFRDAKTLSINYYPADPSYNLAVDTVNKIGPIFLTATLVFLLYILLFYVFLVVTLNKKIILPSYTIKLWIALFVLLAGLHSIYTFVVEFGL